MADLTPALRKTLIHEGGWVNDPHDPGGETVFGITRRDHPDWPGWARVDRVDKSATTHDSWMRLAAELEEEIAAVYRVHYWSRILGDLIPQQELAEELFDAAVNCGVARPVRWLQEIMTKLLQADTLDVDGQMGPATLRELRKVEAQHWCGSVLHDFREARRAYYRTLATRNPALQKFLRGWLARVGP